jgi:hypothetical protein
VVWLNNIFIILLITLLVAVSGFITYFAISKGFRNPISAQNCQALLQQLPPPAGPVESQGMLNIYDGRVSPKVLYVQGLEVFLIVNNLGSKPHNVILAAVQPNCQEVELRRMEGLLNHETRNIRIALKPGVYVTYCDLRVGEHSHREAGEFAYIVVR